MAAGGGTHRRGPGTLQSWNQWSGARRVSVVPSHPPPPTIEPGAELARGPDYRRLPQGDEGHRVMASQKPLQLVSPGQPINPPILHPRSSHMDYVEYQPSAPLCQVEPQDDVRQLLRPRMALVVAVLKYPIVREQEQLLPLQGARFHQFLHPPHQVIRLPEIRGLPLPAPSPSPGLVPCQLGGYQCGPKPFP